MIILHVSQKIILKRKAIRNFNITRLPSFAYTFRNTVIVKNSSDIEKGDDTFIVAFIY
jgi:hypothetical protein